MINRCNIAFDERVLFINNVSDIDEVRQYADVKIKNNVIDKYYLVDDYADKALDFFNISKNSFKGGYYYSIAELVGIYLCKTQYLLHFSSDSTLEKNQSDWIEQALAVFSTQKNVLVANPTWDFKYKEAKKESIGELDDFYLGYGFSDQCYLIRADDFKKDIYNETHEASNRYPEYGGDLFEKRVDSYMRNHELLRITSKNSSYIHSNFPKKGLKRILRKFMLNHYKGWV